MKKSLVTPKSMADKLAKLPAETAGGVIKHLIGYVYGGEESDSRYRMFEKMVDTCKKASTEECERIIAYLNSRLKTRYTLTDATRARIDARFAEGHTVEDFITVIDPTCGNKGRIIYTCSYCEKSRVEVIPATGKHEMVEWTVHQDVDPAFIMMKGTCARETCLTSSTSSFPSVGSASGTGLKPPP